MRFLDRLYAGDRAVTRRVAAWEQPSAELVLSGVEWAASGTKVWWAGAVALAWGGGWRGRRAAAYGVAGMLCAQIAANAVGKQAYDRSRPPAELIPYDDPEDRPDSSSFPSGHTAAAVAFAASVAPVCRTWGIAAGALASLVGLQRVASGAHYASDVAAGAVIGLASAALVHHAPGRSGSLNSAVADISW